MPPSLREEFCPVCTLQGALSIENAPAKGVEFPARLGDYELLEEIARGGVGVVYKARQASLGRIVALKLLIAGQFADPKARARFRTEAEAAARLKHPNIVTIHEVGEHDGQPFIVMEFMENGTLAQRIRGEPMRARAAVRYLIAIARAVEFAHRQSTLHRDLKPSNILLDAFDEPRVTDFGLAKQVGADSELTLTGQVFGSPSFMAPEQAAGDHAKIGPGTDVYALGAILYQLVTGRPPFQGESAPAVLKQIEREEPLRPQRLNPSVPADLETIILKCLEKSPDRRYVSALALAEDLQRFLDHKPVRARPISPVGRAWRWSQRHPVVASLSAIIVLLLMATAAVSTLAAWRIQRAERSARTSLRDALLEQARAQRHTGRMGQQIDSLKAVRAAVTLNHSSQLHTRLRSEAIAALALTDAETVHTRNLPPPTTEGVYLFSPDLRRLARLDATGRVIVEDFPEHGGSTFGFRPPENTARIAAFAPGSDRLVTQRSDGQVQVWNWRTGSLLWETLPGLAAVAFSVDGERFAAASLTGPIFIFNAADGALLREFSGRGKGYAIAFSPDARRLACARGNSRDVELIALDSGESLGELPHPATVIAMAWRNDGHDLVTASVDGMGYVWNTESRGLRFRLQGHDWTVAGCAYSANGSLIATASYDNTTRLWDADTGRMLLTIPEATYQVQFAPDNRHLSFIPTSGRVGMLALHSGKVLATLSPREPQSGLHCLAFSSDGRWLATLSEADLNLWDFSARRLVHREPIRGGRRVLFHPREPKLLIVTRRNVSLREFTPDEPMPLRPGNEVNIATGRGWWDGAFSAEGEWIALANVESNEATVVRSDGSGPRKTFGPHNGISAVALSPDGRLLATAPFIGAPVQVWDVPSGRRIQELQTGPKCDANFSPDGRWLLTVGKRAQLWDTTTWKEVPHEDLDQHTINAGHGVFSRDGRWLAVTDQNRQTHLLQFPACRRVGVLEGRNQSGIFGLQFHPAGNVLAAVCSYGRVQIWDLAHLQERLDELGLPFPADER